MIQFLQNTISILKRSELKFPLYLVLLIGYSSLFCHTIAGTVVDDYRKPLSEVGVSNKSSYKYTYTNDEGDFLLEGVSYGDTLQFSLLGYETKTIIVNDLNTPIQVTLHFKVIELDPIVISSVDENKELIAKLELEKNPVNSSQDLLRKVPGIFIGQHGGGGKAEQIFLRGFDIDHGTDINLEVDGLPVNMVSHAHGQGYSDLHFVIPETVEKIDFDKGPYNKTKGNFATAGYVSFLTKEKLETSMIKLEKGQFNSNRLLTMLNVLNQKDHNAYAALDFMATDGPFNSPQNFKRINFFTKYTGLTPQNDRVGVTVSHFTSNWDASGQVPQRAVDNGLINRFGAIDDTEGGNTSRTNLLLNYDKVIDDQSLIKNYVFLNRYTFDLYSNFTFFLEDSINGDQIKQQENRMIYGFKSQYERSFDSDQFNGDWQAGISLRHDQSKENLLSHTLNRKETIELIQLGDVNETNIGAYTGANINFKKWEFDPSLRIDFFDFQYNDALVDSYQTLSETKAIVSPKFDITYNQSQDLQLYLKMGKGFHSNDTRVVLEEQNGEIIPSAYGFDAGFNWNPKPEMLINVAYWYLYLEQEFVYVGDAGIVEPSGRTRRQGIELSCRYQPLPWLFWNFDANYTHARAIDEPEGENFIPLAPDFTLVNGISVKSELGIFGGINFRYLKNRPANEDYSITAQGYGVTDLTVGYERKKISLSIQIQNLFNIDWNETQFATESRLKDEAESVEEIHFTPGTPFYLKTILRYKF